MVNRLSLRSFHPLTAALAASAALAVLHSPAHAQAPTPTAAFAPYIGVRLITNALPATPPAGAYVGRRLAYDRTGAFGGRIAVATDNYGNAAGRIDLIDPTSGAMTQLGGPDLHLPTAVAMPQSAGFANGVYYFQQFDFPGNASASRKVYSLPPGGSGLGSVLSGTGMDAGSGLAFAPSTFGATLGGHLFGSDSGNAPGFTSGDGVRRWDAAGNYTNEVMGPIANNPDSYTDVTFTGPEFGAFSNRLVAINTTGVAGENVLMWSEATLLANNELGAYNARQVFAVSQGSPVWRATYGAYGATGYLFAHDQGTMYRYDAGGNRAAFLTAVPGFNDVEFGRNRMLYVADLYTGMYEVGPSPPIFARWLAGNTCSTVSDLAPAVATWQVGGACPGSRLLCQAAQVSACGGRCLTTAQAATVVAAVNAICADPC